MESTTCEKCGKKFNFEVTNMHVPGGKEREYIYCPYCNQTNGSEVTSGFIHSYKLEELNSK